MPTVEPFRLQLAAPHPEVDHIPGLKDSGHLTTWVHTAIELTDGLERALSEENIPPVRSLNQALTRSRRLLTEMEVERLEGSGPVNEDSQEILDVVAADSPAMDYQVASTVRPGYRFADRLIRPQQVIAYRWADGEAAESGVESL